MNFIKKFFGVLSLLALTEVIKADTMGSTFETASPKNPNICRSLYNGSILAHATDCQKFYVCVNRTPYEYNCDPNFHFDSTTRTCEAGSQCSTVTETPSTCNDGNIKSIEDDCYNFEVCVKGQYQKLNCPANYYFHAPQGICVPLVFNAQFKCSCVLPEHTVVANVNNCETYFKCEGRTSVLENCPLGQYYNSSVNACITDLEGICLMTPTKTPDQAKAQQLLEMATSQAKSVCADNSAQFQTFAQACNKFYICINGKLQTQDCPKGFYYDTTKKYCLVDLENKCNGAEDQQIKQVEQQEQVLVQESIPAIKKPFQQKPLLVHHDKLFSKFIKF